MDDVLPCLNTAMLVMFAVVLSSFPSGIFSSFAVFVAAAKLAGKKRERCGKVTWGGT